MTQDQALTILKTGVNVFLTGEPGAGKTYVINRYVQWLRERGIEPAITASTGIAATHIGGMTIHAWSGIGIKKDLSDWELEAMMEREPLVRRVRNAQVLIIDEVSMLDANLLELLDRTLCALRGGSGPFGGLQVVFVGDFFQLPPVNKEKERSRFAFESAAWEAANPLVCYLSEQHRQDDELFLGLLAAMRQGQLDDEHRELLRTRYEEAEAPEGATRLYPHNEDVDRINADALGLIDAAAKVFHMREQGSKTLVEALKRGCLSPEALTLKEGARVMFTRNNFEVGFVNGTLGTVEGWSPAGWPLVRLSKYGGAGQGKLIEAEPEEWRIEDGKRLLASIAQVPLRLAWAMTVHKSQGMSLDAAVMDLSGAFEYGQGYVALSRVRTLGGLYLLGFNEQALRVHPDILARDAAFRTASASAEEIFGRLPHNELADLQKKFIAAAGGSEPAPHAKKEPTGGASKLEKLRTKYPQAYRPWSRDDDDKLTAMFRDGSKVSVLVKTFGRQRGSISARLIRLGLVEPELD